MSDEEEDYPDSIEEDLDEPRSSGKGRKVLVWVIVILLALPVLFWLFEYVVPRFLPANF